MSRQAVPTSALSDLLDLVGPVFSQMGDTTPIMIGKGFLERGIGAGPRVVFVPETKGRWGASPKLGAGYSAGVTTGCAMYVRGVETGDDATRFRAAEILAALTINVVKDIGQGRINGGDWGDDSPLPVDSYGADLALSFTFTWPVPIDPRVRDAVKRALTPVSPEDPMRPNGDSGKSFEIDPSTEGSR